jgi:hypothetical protein
VPLLGPRGVLVLVCPLSALTGYRDFVSYLDCRIEDVSVYRFPDHVRQYGEICIVGRRRKTELSAAEAAAQGTLHAMELSWRDLYRAEWLPVLGEPFPDAWNRGRRDGPSASMRVYDLPLLPRGPATWAKVSYTDGELLEVLDASPLMKLFEAPPTTVVQRPPLPLAKGHVGLLLASGILDGLVESTAGAHVVRGSASKVEYLAETKSTENAETGAVTEKQIFAQRPVLTLRAIDESGTIHTFTDGTTEDADCVDDSDMVD